MIKPHTQTSSTNTHTHKLRVVTRYTISGTELLKHYIHKYYIIIIILYIIFRDSPSMAEEFESVESCLERNISGEELKEVKRILYGRELE